MLWYLTGLRSLPVAAALAGGIFLIDTLTSLQFAVASLNVIVVLIAAHDFHRRGVVITAVTCAFLTVFSYVLVHGFVVDGTAPLRSAVSLVSIVIATILVLRNVLTSGATLYCRLRNLKVSTSLVIFPQVRFAGDRSVLANPRPGEKERGSARWPSKRLGSAPEPARLRVKAGQLSTTFARRNFVAVHLGEWWSSVLSKMPEAACDPAILVDANIDPYSPYSSGVAVFRDLVET
jgi:hypothetical protein